MRPQLDAQATRPAEAVEPLAIESRMGSVCVSADGALMVRHAGGMLTARKAVSCLVDPGVGDTVLYADTPGVAYVLAVLERQATGALPIGASDGVAINAGSGGFDVSARGAIALRTTGDLALLSDEVVHRATSATVDYEKATVQSRDVTFSTRMLRTFATTITTFAEQLMQKAQSYIRHSESLDEVNARQMTRNVRGMYSLDSNVTIMVSKHDTKIDGSHIHMG